MTRRDMLTTLMTATGGLAGIAFAQKAATQAPHDKLTVADQNVRQLLLLMDSDQNGRISKREWMSFMEAEFNKLDKDGSGELDPKELLQTRLVASGATR